MIEARSGRDRAACPGCGTESARVHGRYHRWLADTALAGRPVVIRLLVRRLVCREAACARVTFVEQIPGLTRPHSRYSPPLRAALTAIGVALAGRPGARVGPTRRPHLPAEEMIMTVGGPGSGYLSGSQRKTHPYVSADRGAGWCPTCRFRDADSTAAGLHR
ncbi:transposase family protein [Actinoplanes sp. ATCC 53533]|uniref:transposase family protein n=1 Tax=Actinoplanes sp. ATCC 53533 TaxID=1288362 RepID=UPI003515863F